MSSKILSRFLQRQESLLVQKYAAVLSGTALASRQHRTALGSQSLLSKYKYYGLTIQRWNSNDPTSSNSNENNQERRSDSAGTAAAEDERHPDAEKEPLPQWPGGINPHTGERGGPAGPEPIRYGDWERKGRVSDF